HASRRRSQSSIPPLRIVAHSAGSGSWSSPSGQPAARIRWLILFHSIWNATRVGTRSSTSDSLASRTASVSPLPSYQRRRRAGASTGSHSSSGPMPERADDPGREAPDRVEERAEIELVAAGERVEARLHRAVRRLEHAQARFAA